MVGVFKKSKKGITLADVTAGTGLPLEQVRTLVTIAADEYSARLEVTESSEILYSFPSGFTSRYRGPGPVLKKFFTSFGRVSAAALKLLFKAWILLMLVGYFLLFMVIALASVFISFSASSNSRNRRGGWNISFGLFDLIIRLWFYSELFGGGRRRSIGSAFHAGKLRQSGGGRPLHRAVFSFVFGEDDPNRDWELREKKAFVSHLRKQRGVVSLPELMVLSGQPPQKAEDLIMNMCAEFGGSPEVTEEGTVVYRFDEILLSAEKNNTKDPAQNYVSSSAPDLPAPLYKRLKVFSSNPRKMNFWFGIINGVNLLFGSYFFYNSVSIGKITNEAVFRTSGLYGTIYYFLGRMGADPHFILQTALGLVPLLFSVLFWLIPVIRSVLLKKGNESIRLDNYRSLGFGRIWSSPLFFVPRELTPADDACRPACLEAAQLRLVKEMGAYSAPEISIGDDQSEVYTFPEINREKEALAQYRLSIDPGRSETGKTIFDSGS